MILNTRPAYYRARTEAAFADAGMPVVHWPLLTPRATSLGWPDPSGFDAILLTSPMAVTFVPPSWHGHMAFVVGEATELTARAAGFTEIIRAGQDVAGMSQSLAWGSFKRAFYASAADVTVDLALAFPETVERRAVYEMVAETVMPANITEKIRSGRTIAPLFSRRSADTFAQLLLAANLGDRPIDVVGMSASVLSGASAPWRTKIVAAQPTLAAVAVEVKRLAQAETLS